MRQLSIRSIAHPAVREGVLCGIILGVILLVISIIANFSTSISTLLNYAFIVGGYGYVGYRAARITRLVKTGIVAGLIAGSIAYFIGLLANMLLLFFTVDAYRKGLLADPTISAADKARYTDQYILLAYLFTFATSLVVVGTAAGALFGAVGGLIAKRSPALTRVATTSDTPANVVDALEPSQSDIAPRRPMRANTPLPRFNRPIEPVEVVDADGEIEPIQADTSAEEVESSPNEVIVDAAEPAQDEAVAQEVEPARGEAVAQEVEPSQDEAVTGDVKETPTPATPTTNQKKNYRSFLSQ